MIAGERGVNRDRVDHRHPAHAGEQHLAELGVERGDGDLRAPDAVGDAPDRRPEPALLAAQRRLEFGIGARRRPQLHGRPERGLLERGPHEIDRAVDALGPGRLVSHQLRCLAPGVVQQCRGEVLGGGDEQLRPGREVVQQPAPRDAGPGLHSEGRRTGVPILDQAGDSGIEDEQPAVGGPLRARPPTGCGVPHERVGGHRASVGGRRRAEHSSRATGS
jgi:hypothetical protein